ncbi:MAG TPA: SOS response-associated peptidase [Acidimicrobiia bacterium]
MCGRYVQASSPELLAERFGVDEVRIEEHEPRYNVAPRAEVPAVRRRHDRKVLSLLRWGLVPSWAKDTKIGDRLINARAEAVADKPAFRGAFARRRCLIPADGFYEWRAVPGRRRKQPMFVHRRDGEPMAFAGLWEVWREREEDDWLRSCVIVTTDANDLLMPIHDRMPVILPESAWDTWLDPETDPDTLKRLLVPAPDDLVVAYPVSLRVNRADNEGPDLVREIHPDADSDAASG